MSKDYSARLADIVSDNKDQLLDVWLAGLFSKLMRRDKAGDAEVRQKAAQFLPLLADTLKKSETLNIQSPEWGDLRQLLEEISQSRVRQGFTPIETASFIFSLKEPLFDHLRKALGDDSKQLADSIAVTSTLFDDLGLFTVEVYQKAREQVILRQQQELLELSTPVVQLWDGILALPLIGTLDSARTQVVMESLLEKIVETGSEIAIIDITGVPTVDTLVAQHLLKTIAAARLMGADCIISGIRPQIAQTIVHLGVNLEDVITKSTLADAFIIAMKRTGASINTSESRQQRA
ncbi:STAS domain-containing protein [Allohahella marinimesophila]|uniref:STAS domain-containing protein n=1 Tax=Allohahella marinimesophila TaxID=1054972 RepID=A0ABP7NS91_9GAMM